MDAVVFSSQTFLFYFLPLVLLLYAAVPRSRRNLALLVPSLIFYVWGAGGLVGILLLSIAGNWWVGRALGRGANARVCVTASLVLNGAILGYFKYANFFFDQVNAAGARVFGFGGFEVAAVALPIGISFYTFQATSYVIDVARGRTQPVSEFVDFALYVASFPQLIAGPIVRFHEVAPQLRSRPFDWGHVSSG
ncbi:MAG: MBOAT family O-acyltransferase, partial [Myxococcota bacterium]